MTLTYLVLALIIVLGLAVYILAQSLKAARQRVKVAEGKQTVAEANYHAAMTELRSREEDRHALETKLASIQTGTPDARVAASLGVLQDAAAHTSGAGPDRVAGSRPPARDGN